MHEDPIRNIEDSLTALRKGFFLILGISIIAAIVSYGIAKNIPGTYEVHYSYMISMDQKDVAPGFRYDGYYALSAADLFSATLASMVSSPETIIAAYAAAGIQPPTQDAIRLVRIVRSEKAAPQMVRITVTDASKKNAEDLTAGLISVLGNQIETYNAKGLSSIVFHAIPTEPWTGQSKVAPIPIAVSVFTLFFLLGNMVVLFREALKRGAS